MEHEFSPKPEATDDESNLLKAYEKEYGQQTPDERKKLLEVFRGARQDKEIEEKIKKVDPDRG